jgi:predicted RND superfamily exporter protein
MAKEYDRSVHAKRYNDEEQAIFCDLAQSVGIGRAIRELGYPTPTTGMTWMDKRGIEPAHNELMEKARKFHKFYKTEDLLATVDNAMAVVEEMYAKVDTPDDMKKLSEAIQKLVNTRLLLEGKANNITEKRETTQADLEIAEMLRAEQAKQSTQSVELDNKAA